MLIPLPLFKNKLPQYTFRRKIPSDQKLLSVLVITLLSISSFLFMTSKSWSREQYCESKQTQTENPDIKTHLEDINRLAEKANAGQEKIPVSIIEELVNKLANPNPIVRCIAIDALTGIGAGAESAIEPLVEILSDQTQPIEMRHNAIMALKSINANLAKISIITSLNDKNHIIRSAASEAISSMKWDDKSEKQKRHVISELIKLATKDQYQAVRGNAIATLGSLKQKSELSTLTAALTDALRDTSWRVRNKATEAISQIAGKDITVNSELTLNLLQALKNQNATLRTHAAGSIEELEMKDAEGIFVQLRSILKSDVNINARGSAAKALKNDAKLVTIKALFTSFGNQKEEQEVRRNAFESIKHIFNYLQDSGEIKDLKKSIEYFDETKKNINRSSSFEREKLTILENYKKRFEEKINQGVIYGNTIRNPWFWGMSTYLFLYLGIFWLRPLWLLKIDEFLKPISLKLGAVELSARFLSFLRFNSRVLDAWVASHIQSVQEEFQKIESVEARRVYIPIPAVLNGRTLPQITSQDMRDNFNKPLLIWGEGGVGKTSLSCKIAQWAMAEKENERLCQHRMLPIFIEEDLDCPAEACKNALLDAVLGQLKILSNEEDPVSKEFLERLLRRRRILVIVDHLSEMNEQTRKAIDPEKPDFPINALIVTSRQEEKLGPSNKIKPMRIMGNRLSSFLEAYLMQQGKRDLFTDSEFFDSCSHLSKIVGQRDITPMLATLYVKQLITAKLEISQGVLGMPENIPELMISYLNELNRDLNDSKLKENKFDDRTVHQDAKAVAWACVQETYYPTTIKRDIALSALVGRNGKAEEHLQYLEERLHLIQTVGATKDHVRFSLDPLAEYLAAMHMIDIYKGEERQWLKFLDQVQTKPNDSTAFPGFLRALQECCLIKEREVSPQILTKLSLVFSGI